MIQEVWCRIDGMTAAPVLVEGSQYYFQVPTGVTGTFPVEIWATDTAGNTSYRAGICEIREGTIKCFRWLSEHGRCTMLRIRRESSMTLSKGVCEMLPLRRCSEMTVGRGVSRMLPHTCPLSEVA